jgi:hypothetical protein
MVTFEGELVDTINMEIQTELTNLRERCPKHNQAEYKVFIYGCFIGSPSPVCGLVG